MSIKDIQTDIDDVVITAADEFITAHDFSATHYQLACGLWNTLKVLQSHPELGEQRCVDLIMAYLSDMFDTGIKAEKKYHKALWGHE